MTADHVVLALPFSILRDSVDYSAAGFSDLKRTAIEQLSMATNSKLTLQFSGPSLACAGAAMGRRYADTGYQSTWEVSRAQPGHERDPRRLHRRHDRQQLRRGHARQPRKAVPGADRAAYAGHHARSGTASRRSTTGPGTRGPRARTRIRPRPSWRSRSSPGRRPWRSPRRRPVPTIPTRRCGRPARATRPLRRPAPARRRRPDDQAAGARHEGTAADQGRAQAQDRAREDRHPADVQPRRAGAASRAS